MNRQELRNIVERLPEKSISLAFRLLQAIESEADPMLKALEAAPQDDEELEAEDLEALQKGLLDLARGDVRKTAELFR